MTEQALRKMIATGESTRQEFKSWVKCKDYRQRKELAVKSAVALANTKGGVLLFGVMSSDIIHAWVQQRLPKVYFVPGQYSSDNAIGVSILAAREAGLWLK